MRELLQQLLTDHRAGREFVYCRLVETRGSTPQKAGAAMLIYADGSQFGTLGGGCVEAEVKRRAIALLPAGNTEILTFHLDNDYGWDDGLICGGRMQVLVEPLRDATEVGYYAKLRDIIVTGGGTEAVVLDSAKAGLPAGTCLLFDAEGRLLAERSSDVVGAATVDALRPALAAPGQRPRPCQSQGVTFLPILERCRLLIVGGGHVGQALGRLAAELDFDVWVVDDRAEFVSDRRFPQAERRICGPIGTTLRDLPITANTYAVIVTRGHNHDEEALFHLAQRGARYVGMIGSRRKIKLIFEDLLVAGVPEESLAQVYAPLGIDIGSQTVPEIAVSIAAELVAHRNTGSVPGRPAGISLSAVIEP